MGKGEMMIRAYSKFLHTTSVEKEYKEMDLLLEEERTDL